MQCSGDFSQPPLSGTLDHLDFDEGGIFAVRMRREELDVRQLGGSGSAVGRGAAAVCRLITGTYCNITELN